MIGTASSRQQQHLYGHAVNRKVDALAFGMPVTFPKMVIRPLDQKSQLPLSHTTLYSAYCR
jgi:hypothetical protein